MTDNTTVIGQIKNQGGTLSRSLYQLTCNLLTWADNYNIRLSPRHIPGHLNVIADRLSRRHQIINSEWTLSPATLLAVWQTWGKPYVDLFATKDSAKLPVFVSPLPELEAWRTDALSFPWENLWAYAFPPFPLIRATLSQIRITPCKVILIAPDWPTQSWYPLLLSLATTKPLPLPTSPTMLRQPGSRIFHPNPHRLALHAWLLSGPLSLSKATPQP